VRTEPLEERANLYRRCGDASRATPVTFISENITSHVLERRPEPVAQEWAVGIAEREWRSRFNDKLESSWIFVQVTIGECSRDRG
jgi:hypothetical protein